LSYEPGHLPYWLAFTRVPLVGRVRLPLLEELFGDLAAAWRATANELRAAGLDAKTVKSIDTTRETVDPMAELRAVESAGIRAITRHDPEYPALLQTIGDWPPVLFMRGGLSSQDERAVAVVGTRKPTAYGRQAAADLAGALACNGVTVVSGLARGIDGIAHRAALEAGGRTVAVMGSGPDVIYPPEHRGLAEEIAAKGAVISEHPLGTEPDACFFPRRNRILSGLSLGMLVVEAGDDSGALITVRAALEQGRDVFCVPGSIYSPASTATNALIREGAMLVTRVEDVLDELRLLTAEQQARLPGLREPAEGAELAVLDALTSEPTHADELARRAGLPAGKAVSALVALELKGLAKSVDRTSYVRAREASTIYTASSNA